MKIKTLKWEYRLIKDHNNRSGNSHKTSFLNLRHFDKMDSMLGCRPATPLGQLMVESQTEEEGGDDSEESVVSNTTSLITESDSGDRDTAYEKAHFLRARFP